MDLRLLCFVMCATAASAYHRTIGIPTARALFEQESSIGCSERISHGLHSLRRMNPFFGGLIITLTSNETSMCGSTLVSSTKLLTAAHCWNDGEEHAHRLLVVLGSVKLFSGGTRISTNKVETHFAYNPNTVEYDIAIITIPKITFNVFIKPISLPEGDILKETYKDHYARVVGYGKTSQLSDIVESQSLKYAVVAVVNNNECNIYGEYFHRNSMICSVPIFGSPCGGDSGGPLYVTLKKQYLIGIVSYGSINGCDVGHPAVYTRVSYYIDWIDARL